MKYMNRVLVAAALSVAMAAPIAQVATASTSPSVAVQPGVGHSVVVDQAAPRLSQAERRQWAEMVATPEGRGSVLKALQESFGGAVTIGVPASTPGGGVSTNLATGITGDHFWIIASYADVVNGAVAGGVAACSLRVPRPLCVLAGDLISRWAAGWGNTSNHGIWAEVYWWPPNVKVGRW
ncbi:hypothetical protein JOD54_004180 [Actinokineospora baliensis]|uniref:hypothetical protein n=1 Tax=Actinokineospora baliensis TaxID=547056 RepID=UPI00195AB639|nr:hypothetical protein [Actinokineospora baliensis]MBM7773976.1 hypothetical protein [Actinokineospora baliensis]